MWLPGPLLAVLLVTYSASGHGGPGFFFLSIIAAALLMLVVPLLQLGLLATPRYRGRYVVVCGLALLIVFSGVVLLAVSGMFSFW